jgi:hypothetical protein
LFIGFSFDDARCRGRPRNDASFHHQIEEATMIRRVLTALIAVPALLALAPAPVSAQGAGGVTGPAFYVDGMRYRTVNTPTDLTHTGAPDKSFDVIYDFGGLQPNVATAAPGDTDYNGGRWRVHALAFVDYEASLAQFDMNQSGDLDSDSELMAALGAGAAIDLGVVKSFVCPVIPMRG